MKATDRVITFSVSPADNATREAVRQIKLLTRQSPITFSQIMCEAIRDKYQSIKESKNEY